MTNPTPSDRLAMADTTADTAAAMLQAIRAAETSHQPLAVGLADALDELLARSLEPVRIAKSGKRNVVYVDDICSIIYHLRNNNS